MIGQLPLIGANEGGDLYRSNSGGSFVKPRVRSRCWVGVAKMSAHPPFHPMIPVQNKSQSRKLYERCWFPIPFHCSVHVPVTYFWVLNADSGYRNSPREKNFPFVICYSIGWVDLGQKQGKGRNASIKTEGALRTLRFLSTVWKYKVAFHGKFSQFFPKKGINIFLCTKLWSGGQAKACLFVCFFFVLHTPIH